ncbi:MAG: trimethylamine methyltransferase family protein, partial [Candidatus Omnitrophica bacterium]|nr:trimethylamine methyltransferase family protein [Candidatus Omnitrophota bacterium]
KFAQGDKRVASITIPLSRSNIPAPIEQLDAIMLMARLSDKKIGATDATVPESVPFLAEMGVVLGHKPGVFVGCCNCINPPLRLERRTAETMIQRSKYHSRSMITSMPALGGSAPVDIQGTVILATAEIVGGLILSFIIDPEAPLLGYIASVQVDMRSGNPASSSPQTIKVDAGVFQLMEYAFGGGTGVGGRSYISAKRPGLQAVFERFLKAVGYSELADGHMFGFSGNGNLDNGSMVSPEQYLLDMEITGGLENMWTIPAVSDEDITGRISKNILEEGGNFLAAEHTIANYRKEAWFPRLFSYSSKTPSEQEMLDACHATYRETVAGYRPASYPAEILKELDAVYKKAKKALIK